MHTLDLVVLAAEWGHGRRSGSLSNIHLGARDPAGGEPVMVGKTFKGMTDELLAWQTRTFPELTMEEPRLGRADAARRSSWRSPSTEHSAAAAIRAASPCASPASCATDSTRRPAEADTLDAVRELL